MLAWLCPGLAHYFLAEKMRGVCLFGGVVGLYLLGLLIGGVRIVEAPPMDWSRPVTSALSNTTFLGQMLTGPVNLISARASAMAAAHPSTRDIRSHARVNEIGTLYTVVAGLLNLLAIIDAASRAAAPSMNVPAAPGENSKETDGVEGGAS